MLKRPESTQKNYSYSPAPPLEQCLAKTVEQPGGTAIAGVDVETHCIIVGTVARELVRRFPDQLKRSLFPSGVELIAAVHDVGKIHPHFLEKLLRSTDYIPNSYPGLRYADPSMDQQVGFHSGVSQSTVAGIGRYIPEILGSHHGKPADVMSLRPAESEILGGEDWQKRRLELIDRLKEFFSVEWPVVTNDVQALLFTGLTTVSDWIGSSSRFDNFQLSGENGVVDAANTALDEAGLIPPRIRKNLRFADLFDGYSPFPMQSQVMSIANQPGIYVIEERMGQGKTEAALAAAYSILEKGDARGIYFALPSQLTSDSIHRRFGRFLDKILDDSDRHNAGLLHGKAWLYETEMGEDARPGYSWFEPKKRGLLAPFAVGTIDQALMAVMNVRHGFVRAFGLAGKVVILDEVHTYDAYTGSILDVLIQALYQLGCTVIILSATLTTKRVQKFLGTDVNPLEHSDQYPVCLGRHTADASQIRVSDQVDTEVRSVQVTSISDDDTAFNEVFRRASAGQYVLWIENTVRNAQDVYKVLSAWASTNDCDAGLLHSRFTGTDRHRIETVWVEAFGKDGRLQPDGRGKILVGTQVLEQSLDIDADFLVTRLAPTDMLLQRIGRLWRHRAVDSHRVSGVSPEVAILMPDAAAFGSRAEYSFGDSRFVYAPYVLSRTFEVWSEIVRLDLPNDIRALLEATYRERQEQPPLDRQLSELNEESEKLRRFARVGMAKAGITWSDAAPTRYSERETRDVLLLLNHPGTNPSVLVFADGTKLDLPPTDYPDLSTRKRIAREIHEHLISVPISQIPTPTTRQQLMWLSPYVFIGRGEPLVSVAMVASGGEIRSLSGAEANDTYELFYLDRIGYVHQKKRDGGSVGK